MNEQYHCHQWSIALTPAGQGCLDYSVGNRYKGGGAKDDSGSRARACFKQEARLGDLTGRAGSRVETATSVYLKPEYCVNGIPTISPDISSRKRQPRASCEALGYRPNISPTSSCHPHGPDRPDLLSNPSFTRSSPHLPLPELDRRPKFITHKMVEYQLPGPRRPDRQVEQIPPSRHQAMKLTSGIGKLGFRS